jgi:hypothetical protein
MEQTMMEVLMRNVLFMKIMTDKSHSKFYKKRKI